MKQIQNFRFNDLVLYCKGWYESSGNTEESFFNDLERAIKMDDNHYYYNHRKMHKSEIIHFLLNALDLVYEHLDNDEKRNGRWYYSHSSFYEEVQRRMHLYDCSQEYAIALLVHGILQGLTKDEIKLNKPVYKKGSWRLGSYWDDNPQKSRSMTYKYMNKRASMMFDKK